MSAHRALLVLNQQVGFISDPPQGIPAARTVRQNIGLVLEQARLASSSEQAPRIIHFRNCGEKGDLDEEGTPTWELLHAPQPGETVMNIRKSNAFSNPALEDLIAPEAEIVVVGLMSEYAIKSTCRAALARGNTVLLIRGAHGTYDHREITESGRLTPAHKISDQVEADLDDAGVMVLDMKYLSGIFEGR
ncbi:streptothricin hydrolase [Favolaschia claudopus]|uniref:Streptothricin hydrolase n=1 Tax=Favolaschia claudopus TaxID=2862362 RepID=A0AAW0DYA6_9AGAR